MKMKIRVTEKGKAFLAAIECGLIPETDEGYDEEKFVKFWHQYIEKLYNRILWKKTVFSVITLIFALIALLIK